MCAFFVDPAEAKQALNQARAACPDMHLVLGAMPLGHAFALTVGWAQEADGPKPSCSFGAGFGQFEVCGANIATSLSGKWAITPSLTMDVSIFPDFSQLGADAAQLTVNNRYALYLPERRPFFIEGKEIFDINIDLGFHSIARILSVSMILKRS